MDIPTDDYYARWVERTLNGNYRTHGRVVDAACVVAPAFGIRSQSGTLRPGLSNEDLALQVGRLAPALPVITQPELAMALRDTERTWTIDRARVPGERLDTTEFLQQCHDLMAQHRWEVALLVAHPNHITWVDYICSHLGIVTVAPEGLESVRFDPESDQYWTRDLPSWQKEVRARRSAGDARTVTDR